VSSYTTNLERLFNVISRTAILPVIVKLPVTSCLSSSESPNLVEPLSYIIEADTNSV
jgi:hypothetical protein